MVSDFGLVDIPLQNARFTSPSLEKKWPVANLTNSSKRINGLTDSRRFHKEPAKANFGPLPPVNGYGSTKGWTYSIQI